MFEDYEKFLEELNAKLKNYFELHSDYICCKEGCSKCCEIGDYPFSFLEMKYIMHGFLGLDKKTQSIIREKIRSIQKEDKGKHFFYECPFLINNRCSVYKYRGIICRTFGLAYFISKQNEKGEHYVKLPECVKEGLNYSKVYNKETGEVEVAPFNENLDLPNIVNSDLAKKYNLDFGDIQSLIYWFD